MFTKHILNLSILSYNLNLSILSYNYLGIRMLYLLVYFLFTKVKKLCSFFFFSQIFRGFTVRLLG